MRQGDCRHYRGWHHDATCEADINLRQLVGGPDAGWVIRLPCLAHFREKPENPRIECPEFRAVTDDELREDQATVEAAVLRMEKVAPLVDHLKTAYAGKTTQGRAKCPACGDKLSWSISGYNGHVWMKCPTEDCVNFME
jgi:hypothetical protein